MTKMHSVQMILISVAIILMMTPVLVFHTTSLDMLCLSAFGGAFILILGFCLPLLEDGK